MGRPQLIAVEGPEGIGKTALLRRFLDQAAEPRTLRARAEELEATLPFAVIERLVSGVPTELPGPLRAVGSACGESPDPFAVGTALIVVLGALQQAGPVILIIDDAQWADTPSLQALVFGLRRLNVDRVMAVVVVRELADARIPEALRRLFAEDRSIRLRLSGLDIDEIDRLAHELGVHGLPRWALARLYRHTHGNPSHIRALLEEVSPQTLRDGSQSLPAPQSVALPVLHRLASCPTPVSDLVAAAAVLGVTCRLESAAHLAGISEPLVALEQALLAGILVELSTGPGLMVAFRHPLIRAAVYQALGPTRRTRLHARAATLVDDEETALRHRLLATSGTDPRLANDVARLARRQMAAGAWEGAAEGLRAAARLLRSSAEQGRRLLEAIECMLLAGDVGGAIDHANETEAVWAVGQREYILGRLALIAGHAPEAETRLHAAWRTCEPSGDPALCARIAGALAQLHMLAARGLEAVNWTNRVLELDPTAVGTDIGRYIRVVGLAASGRPADALAATAGLPDPTGASLVQRDVLLGRGLVRGWTDDLAGAHHDLTGLVGASRDSSVPFQILALASLSQIEYRRGNWDDALVHAEQAVALTDDSGHQWLAAYAHAMATLVVAARGSWSSAEAHVTAGWTATCGPDYPWLMAYASLADGHLRAAEANHSAVIAALNPMLTFHYRDGVDEPGVIPWPDLLIDALAAVGEYRQAEALLERWETRTADRNRRSVRVALARARGNLEAARGDRVAADLAFQFGLETSQEVPEPFALGLLKVAYGGFLRRTNRRTEAASQLEAARDIFARLAARPYLERCEQELLGCGLGQSRRQGANALRLTRQEVTVARLAANGRTNRQIAGAMFISVKTVEYHLAKVYTKLGITSRAELASHPEHPRDPVPDPPEH